MDNNESDSNSPQVLVNSSSIYGYTYDSSTYKLIVYYKGKSKTVKEYSDVMPPMVSRIFDSAGSIGKKAYKNLKGLKSIDA